MEKKNKKAITLISLVITIVILLILAGVAISLTVDSDGLFGKAEDARNQWNDRVAEEETKLQDVLDWLNESEMEKWSGEIADSFAGGDGLTEETAYLIENGEQLAYFAQQVNNGETFRGKYVKLVKSIDLQDKAWTPIGHVKVTGFCGVFDGQNNTIANLKIDMPEASNVGLFGYIWNPEVKGIEIKNLTIKNANIIGYSHLGVIVGHAAIPTLSNIILTGTIKVESSSGWTGGIAGLLYGDIADIVIDVTEDSYITNSYWCIGGVVGLHSAGNIANTRSNINVMSNGAVGGIVGLVNEDNRARNYINCSSSGTISCTGQYGDTYASGGIAGNINVSNVIFTGCNFTGRVLKAGEVVEGQEIYGYKLETTEVEIK